MRIGGRVRFAVETQSQQRILRLKRNLNSAVSVIGVSSDMQKACDFAACNHTGPVDACGLNRLGIGCSGCVVSGRYTCRRKRTDEWLHRSR